MKTHTADPISLPMSNGIVTYVRGQCGRRVVESRIVKAKPTCDHCNEIEQNHHEVLL